MNVIDQVMGESWQPVVGFQGLYEISDQGRVASLPKPTWPGRRVLSASRHVRGGYLFVTLHRDGLNFHRKIHHLVCEAFNGERSGGTVARHLDGDVLNNTPENLAWGTPSENNFDQVAHGTHNNASKTSCKNGHPFDEISLYINATSGSRQCRICQRQYAAEYRSRKRKRVV